MLDRKIFFLIIAILASYVIFTTDGLDVLMRVSGLKKTESEADKKSPLDNQDKWQSGGDALTPQQGAGVLQTKFTNDITKMIQDEVNNHKAVKVS